MKKLFSLMLAILMMLTLFAGCDKGTANNDNDDDDGSSDKGSSVVGNASEILENFDGQGVSMSAEDIEKLIADAITKIEKSNSFEMVAKIKTDYDGEKEEEELLCKFKQDGDVITYYYEEPYQGYDMPSPKINKSYYNGKVGYELDYSYSPTMIKKIISDENFTKEYVADDLGFDMFEGLHKSVSKSEPAVEKDGNTYKVSAKIPFKKLGELMDIEVPENVDGSYTFEYYINNGTLVMFVIIMEQAQDQSRMTLNMGIAFNNVNNTEVAVPDFISLYDDALANAEYGYDYTAAVTYVEGTTSVEYEKQISEDGEVEFGGMQIRTGLGSNADAMPILECYKYRTEVEGYKVTSVLIGGFMTGTWGKVERLVIPKGIYVETWEFDEPVTEVFFEDSKDEAQHDEIVGAKGVYYADEWEYVNGLPTPIN